MSNQESIDQKTGCDHVGADGKCTGCTSDETTDCSDCGEVIVVAKGETCTDADCRNIYCSNCATRNLNEYDFCGDCDAWECDSCASTIERGKEIGCKNSECHGKLNYCTDCALRLLNGDGHCSNCTQEDILTCDNCEHKFLFSKIIACKGDSCGMIYCAECALSQLASGLCENCNSDYPDEEDEEEVPAQPVEMPKLPSPDRQSRSSAYSKRERPKRGFFARLFGRGKDQV